MRLNSKWIVVVLVLVGLVSCRTSPLVNFENISVATVSGKPLTLDQVKQAIIRGGATRGWTMAIVSPGHIVGTLQIRRHTAIVDINYDTQKYSIRYKDSVNLRYNKWEDGTESIHSNYSGWLSNLRRDINKALMSM